MGVADNHMPKIIALMTAALFSFTAAPWGRADSSATLVVPDRLCLPGEEVCVEAYLYRSGLLGFFQGRIQGELLRFLDAQENPLRDLLTDPSGMARIFYKAGPPGRYPITVRLIDNPRYSADPATGNLFVQEKRMPLLFVTVEAGLMPSRSTPFLPRDPQKVEPEPGSVKALSEAAICHMPVYLTQWPKPSSHPVRSWLENKGYPLGPLYFLDRPWMEGILSEAPAPETDLLESLWKERSVPAHLVTRDRSLAKAAADKEIRVLLLTEETHDGPPPQEEEHEEEEGMATVKGWAEIPSLCGCKTEGSEK